jgi:hypothetical protein
MTYRLRKRGVSAFMLALAVLLTTAFVAPSVANAAYRHRRLNWAQRHPTLTGVGAGVATHHALKVSAARKKARGQRLNWAERHPTLSGMGVGTATHHVIKKHTPQ